MKNKYYFNDTCLTCGGKVEFDWMTAHNCGWNAAYCKNCGTVYDAEHIIEKAEKLYDIVNRNIEKDEDCCAQFSCATKSYKMVIPNYTEIEVDDSGNTDPYPNDDYEFIEELMEEGMYD